jgi:hypothetical protein
MEPASSQRYENGVWKRPCIREIIDVNAGAGTVRGFRTPPLLPPG